MKGVSYVRGSKGEGGVFSMAIFGNLYSGVQCRQNRERKSRGDLPLEIFIHNAPVRGQEVETVNLNIKKNKQHKTWKTGFGFQHLMFGDYRPPKDVIR